MLSVVVETAWTTEKHLCSSTPKEHAENVIRVVLVELLGIALLEVLFRSMLIIDLSLFCVAQTSKCRTDLLEGITCVGGPVLIWMKLEGEFFISLLDFVL
jgi:hypothetical protein